MATGGGGGADQFIPAGFVTFRSDPLTFPLDKQVYFDASHDNQITSILAAIGLKNGPALAPASGPLTGQVWITSQIVPFSGRLVTERLTCGSGTRYVRFFFVSFGSSDTSRVHHSLANFFCFFFGRNAERPTPDPFVLQRLQPRDGSLLVDELCCVARLCARKRPGRLAEGERLSLRLSNYGVPAPAYPRHDFTAVRLQSSVEYQL